ncbi:LCP family protein [Lactococcus nasutitermitis]
MADYQRSQRREQEEYGRSNKKKKHWLRRISISLLVLILVLAGGLFYLYSNAQHSLKKTYITTKGTTSTIQADKPLTLLLMGVDTGGAGRGDANSWDGNSDSQIVITLNPKTKTTTMVSMERDTMTNILNNSNNIVSTQKMNAAYPAGYNASGISGAVEYAMNTIGEQSGLKINNFLVMNMDGLVNLVNDVGGINVVNDSGSTITIANTEPEYTATVPYIGAGKSQHINGEQALVFSRDRDTLPNGDYGRTAHQREVIEQVLQKMLSLNSVLKYQKFLNDISADFKTNISVSASNIAALSNYKDCFDKVVSIQYQGIGETAAGSDGLSASYQFMPNNVDLAVQNVMRTSIGESAITTLNSNMITYESYFDTTPDTYFMPSVTVTEKGKTGTTVYGVNTDGSLVGITSNNAGEYVSTTGSAVSNGSQ